MDAHGDGDHLMDDDGIIATTEVNGMLVDTLDPSKLVYDMTGDAMSLSPELSRLPLENDTAPNGSSDNQDAVRIIKETELECTKICSFAVCHITHRACLRRSNAFPC